MEEAKGDNSSVDGDVGQTKTRAEAEKEYWLLVWKAWKQPAMILLFLAAAVRHTGDLIRIFIDLCKSETNYLKSPIQRITCL